MRVQLKEQENACGNLFPLLYVYYTTHMPKVTHTLPRVSPIWEIIGGENNNHRRHRVGSLGKKIKKHELQGLWE